MIKKKKKRPRYNILYRDLLYCYTLYKSTRVTMMFFIDLLKYNYLSRFEGQAKMVHSLFRSNACYFSFYQQIHIWYWHNRFISQNYFTPPLPSLYSRTTHRQQRSMFPSELLLYNPIFSFYLLRNATTATYYSIKLYCYCFK